MNTFGIFWIVMGVVALAFVVSAALLVWYFMKKAGNAVGQTGDLVGEGIQKTAETVQSITTPTGEGFKEVAFAVAKRVTSRQKECQQELLDYKMKYNNAMNEVARRENQKLEVSQLKRIFKISLIELVSQLTDFKKETISTALPTMFHREKDQEYIGTIRANFVQHIGVDIEKLQFCLVENTIKVFGLSEDKCVEITGMKDINMEWEFHEIRERKKDKKGKRSDEVSIKDESMSDQANNHQNEVLQRIQESKQFNGIAKAIADMALELLRFTFKGYGYHVERGDAKITGELKNIYQLAEEINGKNLELIAAKENELKILESKIANYSLELSEEEIMSMIPQEKQGMEFKITPKTTGEGHEKHVA